MKRILLTGANGFVGRELTRILSRSSELYILDSLRYGDLRFSEEEQRSFKFTHADIRDADTIRCAMERIVPDVIVHLAAVHFIPECESDPAGAISTNVLGTANLLQVAPPGSHFVFASSGAVYLPDERPHQEDASEVAPSDFYGETKFHGEQYVRRYARQRGFDATIVRLFNVVGPGETNPHLLPEIVAQLKAGRDKILLGNTWPKRDYIDVLDAADGFALIALSEVAAERERVELVNLGTSTQYSVAEILEKMAAVRGAPIAIDIDPSRTRKVDRPFLVADIGKINRLFGWVPRRTIDDAIARLWERPELSATLTERYRG